MQRFEIACQEIVSDLLAFNRLPENPFPYVVQQLRLRDAQDTVSMLPPTSSELDKATGSVDVSATSKQVEGAPGGVLQQYGSAPSVV